ncbi:hypothetical protein CERSUDRAFT_91776 [Gelatoporia subvermispora B]|uniref:Uncharacterized protein n=1 Tax=Ceriporiopsis subvermispora (strain B) TaxID=914234 RepID=M2RQ80_CERS8|nr:hypothetical protein CERSUDRAFT_91776 [Gelatoporia subvermispora B]
MGRNLIRRPRVAHASLQKSMQLRNKDPQFKHFTKHMRKLAKEMLDVSICFRDQDPFVMEDFRAAAIKSYPLLENYENGWPALVYVQNWIGSVRSHLRKANNGQKRNDEVDELLRDSVSEELEVKCQLGENGSYETRNSPSDIEQETPQFSPLSISQAKSKRRSITRSSIASASGASVERPQSFAPSRHAQISVSAVWESLQDELKRKLEVAGVTTCAHIRRMAEWPVSERSAFLQEDVQLDPFESREVNVLLGYALEEKNSTTEML